MPPRFTGINTGETLAIRGVVDDTFADVSWKQQAFR